MALGTNGVNNLNKKQGKLSFCKGTELERILNCFFLVSVR